MSAHDIDPNEHPVRANRGIVSVVIILSILIVLGLGGLVYGMATKAGKLGKGDAAPAAGHRVRSMSAAGGTLYLNLVLPDGREVVRAYNSGGTLLYEIEP